MKHKNKELYLLIWDEPRGKYNKYILNPALKQNKEDEFYVLIGQQVK